MLIKVKVFAKSKREVVKKIKEDKYEIYVIEKARANEANTRVIEIISEMFPENRGIRIIKGHTTPNKIIEIVSPDIRLV